MDISTLISASRRIHLSTCHWLQVRRESDVKIAKIAKSWDKDTP